MADAKQEYDPLSGVLAVGELMRSHLKELVVRCREQLLARHELRRLLEPLGITRSEGWVRQAVSLFRISMESCGGPAREWHGEVGELQVAAGQSIADTHTLLGILRDEILALIWQSIRDDALPSEAVPAMVQAVLAGYDCALGAQAEAYVRESQRSLSEVNHRLRFRQEAFERDLALATLVQQHSIPGNFESKNFRAEVRYVPTTGVGGDHAGIFPVSDTSVYVTICDVTGHGIASALVAEIVNARLRTLLRHNVDTTFEYSVEPVAVIRELNALFYHEFQPLGMLLTFFVALIDTGAGTITYSGAGHPPPLLQCCSQGELIEMRSQNIILGAVEDCVVGEGQNTLSVSKGQRVIFYTDGIIEAQINKQQMLGLKGLRKIVEDHFNSSPSQLADEILLVATSKDESQDSDDMSLILLDILGDK